MKLLLLGHDPGRPEDLLVPMARIFHTLPPGSTLHDIDELPYRLGGRATKPKRPLVFRTQAGRTTMIAGLGVTEAAELQDTAYAVLEREQQRIKEGTLIDREKFGMAPRETLDARIREHMANKARWYASHPVSGGHSPYDPSEKRIY